MPVCFAVVVVGGGGGGGGGDGTAGILSVSEEMRSQLYIKYREIFKK